LTRAAKPLTPQAAVALAAVHRNGTRSVDVSRSIVWLDAAGKPVTTMTSEGVIDFEHDLARLDMPGLAITLIYAKGVLYTRIPHLEEIAKKRWMKVDLTKSPNAPGPGFLVGLGGPQGSDPLQDLHQLNNIVRVVEIGREQVRGVDTRRYRGSITMPAIAGEQQSETVTTEIWIDGENRIRRTRDTFTFDWGQALTASTVAGQGRVPVLMVTTTEYYDFGVKVDVQVPPDSDTISREALSNQK
jgi:hypothetical protein